MIYGQLSLQTYPTLRESGSPNISPVTIAHYPLIALDIKVMVPLESMEIIMERQSSLKT